MLTMRNHALRLTTYLEFSKYPIWRTVTNTTKWNGKHGWVVIEKQNFISLLTTSQLSTGLEHTRHQKHYTTWCYRSLVKPIGWPTQPKMINQPTNQLQTNRLLMDTGSRERGQASILCGCTWRNMLCQRMGYLSPTANWEVHGERMQVTQKERERKRDRISTKGFKLSFMLVAWIEPVIVWAPLGF